MVFYHGALDFDGTLTGTLSPVGTLSGSISIAQGWGIPPDSEYRGHYEVIPDPNVDQELPTKDKFLSENIKLSKIPYFETDNSMGGKTIIIGDKDYA